MFMLCLHQITNLLLFLQEGRVKSKSPLKTKTKIYSLLAPCLDQDPKRLRGHHVHRCEHFYGYVTGQFEKELKINRFESIKHDRGGGYSDNGKSGCYCCPVGLGAFFEIYAYMLSSSNSGHKMDMVSNQIIIERLLKRKNKKINQTLMYPISRSFRVPL
jgi:hypothetical protein